MKRRTLYSVHAVAALSAALFPARPAAADGAFYGDPPDERHPWAIHDANRPQPPRVEPGAFSSQETPGRPPSDAVILFDGTEASLLANWSGDKTPAEPTKWVVRDGAMECVPGSGYIRTKTEWGDCQLHVEWSAPTKVEGHSQGRGNSGVFLQGEVEVQVLDNYNNPTYADGFAGSVYGINPPLVNPLRAPGEWQTYDIVFRRPVFQDGKEVDPGSLTVFVNGVLVQDHTALEGGGGHRGRSKPRPFPEAGPLKLQDHGNPVRYRNIWYRPLPPRAIEGGDASTLSAEATAAKRKEIAASLREKAAAKEGKEKLLGVLEVLTYETEAADLRQAEELASSWLGALQAVADGELEGRKGDVLQVNNAVQYLVKFQRLPDTFVLKAPLEALIKERGWDKKK